MGWLGVSDKDSSNIDIKSNMNGLKYLDTKKDFGT